MTARRHHRRLAAAVALTAAMLTGAATALAQEGPVVIGQKQATNWLTLTPTRAELELLYRGQRDEIQPAGGTKQKFSEDRLEETLTLSSLGSIYHPNLVALDMTGSFGLTQAQIDNVGQRDSQLGTIYAWDATATFLRKEDIVPTLYSRRTRQLVNRTFGPTLDSTITTTGGVLDIRNKDFPTRMEVYHSEQTQSAPDDQTPSFDLSQDAFVWHTDHRPDARQVYTWDYTYNIINQSTGNVTSHFDTQDATLAHSVDFGANAQHNLSSSLHYYNQSGDFASDQLRLDEVLRLRHTDTFETRYQYTYDRQSFASSEQTTNRATAGFIHRLYKSLVTNGTIGVEKVGRNDDANSFETFADLRFDYTKKVPFGRLTAGAGAAYSRQENNARTNFTEILNSPGTFTDSQPIVLVGTNINPASIVVTDPSGLLIFLNGLDYNVTSLPNHVEIDRIVGGRINAGDVVLIDYQLAPQPSNTVATTNFSLNARYDIDQGPLKGLGVYARYADQSQNIDSADPTVFVANSFTDLLVGSDYRFWKMTIGAEQQWHKSTIVPFDATRFWAQYSDPLSASTTLSLNAAYDIIKYTDENNELRLWTISGQLHHRFNQRLNGYATVLWRDERNQLHGDTRGLEEQFELQWRYRQTYIYALFRNANLTSDFQDNSFQFFEIGLRRQF